MFDLVNDKKTKNKVMLFSLFAAVALFAAKIIMTPLLQRDEDYYQKGDDDADV